MIKANITAQIEAQESRLKEVEDNILKLGRLIDGFKRQQSILLSERSDIIWKIEDLKEMEDMK